jgi:molybdate transport system substrate-binding protein
MTALRRSYPLRSKDQGDQKLGTIGYLAIFAWSVAAVMLTRPRLLPWIAGSCLLVAIWVYPRSFRRLVRLRWLALIVLLALPPVFLLGQTDRSLAGIPYSSEGLTSTMQIAIRIFVVLIAVDGLTSSVDIASVAGLLERFGLRGLGFSIGVAFNLLPSLQQSALNTWRSLWMRGGLRKKRWRGLRMLAVTVVAGALGRAEEIALAAEARAFSPEHPRGLPVRIGKLDWAVLALALVGILAVLLLGACTPQTPVPQGEKQSPPGKGTLNVFAAASLTEAFTQIGKAFEEQHPGVSVVFNFAGSQDLAQQINSGAPADVFASANANQMQVAIDGGRIISGSQQSFVQNRLVMIVPADNPAGLQTFKDLAKPGLKVILAARDVPVGTYTLQLLDKASQDPTYGSAFQVNVLKNVVSYENNVKSVLAKIALGEGDAGIVYSSDVTGENGSQVTKIDIPDPLNVIAKYPIAVLKDSRHADLAKAFMASVLSQEGQAALAKFGFFPIGEK